MNNHDQRLSQVLHDLIWAVTSPSLIGDKSPADFPVVPSAWGTQQRTEHSNLWEQWIKNPIPLLEFIEQNPNRRVGRYFEQLLSFFLQNCPSFDLKIQNQQIYEAKRTIGELDFVFMEKKTREARHWECAVKYYLGYPDQTGKTWWIGPNAQDRLDLKVKRLMEHQVRLCETPNAQQVLKQHEIEAVVPQIFMKGYLFYPAFDTVPIEAPELASVSHSKGWWLYADAVESLLNVPTDHWVFLEKPHWLSPLECPINSQFYSTKQIQIEIERWFETRETPLLLAGLSKTESSTFKEITRFFIVPAHWPGDDYGPMP